MRPAVIDFLKNKLILYGTSATHRSKTYNSLVIISFTCIIRFANSIRNLIKESDGALPVGSVSGSRPRTPLLPRRREAFSHPVGGQPDRSQTRGRTRRGSIRPLFARRRPHRCRQGAARVCRKADQPAH